MSRKKKNKHEKGSKRKGEPKPIRYATMESPFFGMTDGERAKFRDDTGEFYGQRFEGAMRQLQVVATSADPIYILTQLVVSNLFTRISPSNQTPASSFKPTIAQPGIELYQAMVLRVTSSDAFSTMPIEVALSQLYELLPQVLESFGLVRMASYNSLASDQERAIFRLQENLRLHTAMIRNWGYYEQSLQILRSLYGEIDEVLRRETKISPISVINVFDHLIRKAESQVSLHGSRLRTTLVAEELEDIVAAYQKDFGMDEAAAVEFLSFCSTENIDAEGARGRLIHHSYEHLKAAFAIDVGRLSTELTMDPAELKGLLDATSLQPGGLSEQEANRFLLDNPIWTRPLIELGSGNYFCPIPQLFSGFSFPILNDLFKSSSVSKKFVELRRAQFLEERVEALFRAGFPDGRVVSRIKWRDKDTIYETDLLVVLDSYVLIVESKSGAVSWPALRGAPGRAKKHIEELIVGPSLQSMRLEEKIWAAKYGQGNWDFWVDSPEVDFSRIWKVARISVTLEDFATIQANVKELEHTGWLAPDFSPAPTLSLADLETVFTIISSQVERLHYFVGRADLEKRIHYKADELDLLGYYIETGFCTGDIGHDDGILDLHLMSSKVDDFMTLTDSGECPVKPCRKLSPWWNDILAQLEYAKEHRWSEAALILLSIDADGQVQIESRVRELIHSVKSSSGKNYLGESIYVLPDGSRADVIALVVLRKASIEVRHARMQDVAQEAFSACDSDRCLVLVFDVDAEKNPYQTLGLLERIPQ